MKNLLLVIVIFPKLIFSQIGEAVTESERELVGYAFNTYSGTISEKYSFDQTGSTAFTDYEKENFISRLVKIGDKYEWLYRDEETKQLLTFEFKASTDDIERLYNSIKTKFYNPNKTKISIGYYINLTFYHNPKTGNTIFRPNDYAFYLSHIDELNDLFGKKREVIKSKADIYQENLLFDSIKKQQYFSIRNNLNLKDRYEKLDNLIKSLKNDYPELNNELNHLENELKKEKIIKTQNEIELLISKNDFANARIIANEFGNKNLNKSLLDKLYPHRYLVHKIYEDIQAARPDRLGNFNNVILLLYILNYSAIEFKSYKWYKGFLGSARLIFMGSDNKLYGGLGWKEPNGLQFNLKKISTKSLPKINKSLVNSVPLKNQFRTQIKTQNYSDFDELLQTEFTFGRKISGDKEPNQFYNLIKRKQKNNDGYPKGELIFERY